MPEVPTHDPFNTKVKGKDQSRMPSGTSHLPVPGMPSMAEMLMAAATMHEQGRLFESFKAIEEMNNPSKQKVALKDDK